VGSEIDIGSEIAETWKLVKSVCNFLQATPSKQGGGRENPKARRKGHRRAATEGENSRDSWEFEMSEIRTGYG
jgi:hypothetical protein